MQRLQLKRRKLVLKNIAAELYTGKYKSFTTLVEWSIEEVEIMCRPDH